MRRGRGKKERKKGRRRPGRRSERKERGRLGAKSGRVDEAAGWETGSEHTEHNKSNCNHHFQTKYKDMYTQPSTSTQCK